MSDIEAIHAEILSNLSDKYEKTVGFTTYDLTRALAVVIAGQYDDLEALENKIDVDKLTGDELERFVGQRKGITRKAASKAIGSLAVTGTGTVTAGDLFETTNGVQFASAETKAIDGSGTVAITAVIAGNGGVVGAGSITLMPVSIPGIVSVTNSEATAGGYDAEDDDALRGRYYIALRTPATSGNKYHYQNWALEVVGVGGAKVFPLAFGNNTVEIVIIDADKQPPDSELLGRVQTYIDPESAGTGEGQAPMGASCTVTAAEGLSVNLAAGITLESGYSSEETRANILSAVAGYLEEIAFTSGAVSYAKLGNAILEAGGVLDYENLTLNGAVSNIAVGEKQVAVLGTAVFTYA